MEMSQVRREADFYSEQMDALRHRQRKGLQTDEEVLEKRQIFYNKKQKQVTPSETKNNDNVDTSLLDQIFS